MKTQDMEASPSARQLVICCDGTNNNLTGGVDDTNVVKLAQLLAQAAPNTQQLVFYDPGVGNPAELPGATWVDSIHRKAQRVAGLAFGRGAYENIAECYLFLMRNYQPGDQIFIFGFSRGAFTARSVAGLVNMFGVLQARMESMLSTLIHTYFSDRKQGQTDANQIAQQISTLFADTRSREVEITFVGVWDTVESVGMGPFSAKITAIPTVDNKRFLNVRQALALDEQRAQFKPRLYGNENGIYRTSTGKPASLQQLWFRGSHCDVGGGYAKGHTGISDRALCWLVSEAVQCGLMLHHNGVSLESEAAVASALGLANNNNKPKAPATVHSQLHATCLWALTGLAVRETQQIDLNKAAPTLVTAVEHSSVGEGPPRFPEDTVWTNPRPKHWLWISMLAMFVFLLAHGDALKNDAVPLSLDWQTWLARGWEAQLQTLEYVRWQLLWLCDGSLTDIPYRLAAPGWAMVWDLGLIAAYAYVLSWFAVAAFARHAGLHRAGRVPSRLLNLLGWALPLAVFSDLLEDFATWLTIHCATTDHLGWAFLWGCWMSIFSIGKFAGLLGVLLLIVLPGQEKSPK
ncbi:MAG: DUF2235 domain-containing protein [Pseudomonadota bacterium]